MKNLFFPIFIVLGVGILLLFWWGGFSPSTNCSSNKLAVVEPPAQKLQLGEDITFKLTGRGFDENTSVSMVLDVSNSDAIVSTFPLGGVFNESLRDNNVLYLASDERGLQVVNIEDPFHPKLLGEYLEGRTITDIRLEGKTLFICQGKHGVAIFNIESSNKLKFITEISLTFKVYKSYFHNNHLYVATGNYGLYVYDLQNLDKIKLVNIVKPRGATFDLVGVANSVYLSVVEKGIVVYDITDPINPVVTGQAKFSNKTYDLLVVQDKLYVASNGGLSLFEISTADQLKLIHRWDGFGLARKLSASSDLIFISDNFVGLRIVDINNPIGTISELINIGIDPRIIESSDDYFFVGGSNKGLLTVVKNSLVNRDRIAKIKTSGNSRDLFIRDNWLYIADRLKGVVLQNLDNLNAVPVTISTRRSIAFANSKNHLFVANSPSGIEVLDTSNAAKPESVIYWDQFYAQHLTSAGRYLVTASGREGLRLIDINNHQNPVVIDCLPDVHALDLTIKGDLLFAVSKKEGLIVYKIKADAELERLSSILPPFPMSEFGQNVAIEVHDDIAYMLNWDTGLQIIDIVNPYNPKILSTLDIPGISKGLLLVGDKIIVSSNLGINYVSVADPQNAVLLSSVPVRGISKGIAVEKGLLYLAQRHHGVTVLPLPMVANKLKIISSDAIVATISSPKLQGSYNLIIKNKSDKFVFKNAVVFTNN